MEIADGKVHSEENVLFTQIIVERMFGDVALPRYATSQSSGMDLEAYIMQELVLTPGAYAAIPTGIKIAMPQGIEAQIRPRSGLAAKHAITVLNSPGTIDADYRGEIRVLLINLHQTQAFTITKGMRIAQMVFAPISRARLQEGQMDATFRGEGGFGSTGV